MTVSSTSFTTDWYSANGVQKNWPFDFTIFDATSVVLQIANSPDSADPNLIETSSNLQLVSVNDSYSSGYITYPSSGAALTAGKYIRIVRRVPYTQTTEIGEEGDFSPEIHERAFDKLTMQAQQLARSLAGVVVINDGITPPSKPITHLLAIDEDENIVNKPITILTPALGPVANNTAQLQAALNKGGTIILAPGVHRIPRGGLSVTFSKTTKLVWELGAEIYFDDQGVGQGNPCFVCLGHPDIDIEFVNPCFRGNWGVYNWDLGSQMIYFEISGRFKSTGGYFTRSRFMTLIVDGAKLAHVEGAWLDKGKRDGIRLTNCRSSIVIGNTLDQIMDDSIAIHTTDNFGDLVDRSITVTGNIIRDSHGIVLVGAKDFTITGNTITRAATRAISVGGGPADPVEGNTATLAGAITGNIIDTVFDGFLLSGSGGSLTDYIRVDTHAPTPNDDGYAEERDGAGGVVSPYPYMHTNNTDDNPPAIGPRNLIIANNTCMRSYEPTANYSDYGLGLRMTVVGPLDAEVTEGVLGLDNPVTVPDPAGPRAQIKITGHLANAIIEGNNLYGGCDGIQLDGLYDAEYLCWKNVLIQGNLIGNYRRAGVYLLGPGMVDIQGNKFDGDPLHIHPARNANGKWDNGNDHCAIFSGDNVYYTAKGNSFKNLQAIDSGTGINAGSWSGNTIMADPAGIAFSANNIGIGNLNYPEAYGATDFIIEDGDPVSANFGRVKNICVNNAIAMPTTGKYSIGWFVRNRLFTIVGNMSLRGWIRKTVGSAHVLGTDWEEVWESIAPNRLTITDAIGAPATVAGFAQIYVDTADGDLKVKFGDGTIKTIVVDT